MFGSIIISLLLYKSIVNVFNVGVFHVTIFNFPLPDDTICIEVGHLDNVLGIGCLLLFKGEL